MTDTVQIGPLSVDRDAVAALCRRRHIQRLSALGTAAGEDEAESIEICLLVEFEPEHTPGFLGLYDIEREISQLLFNSRGVHLTTPGSLDPSVRERVKRSAEVLFAA
jgi:predicted nucleotidyltransferase